GIEDHSEREQLRGCKGYPSCRRPSGLTPMRFRLASVDPRHKCQYILSKLIAHAITLLQIWGNATFDVLGALGASRPRPVRPVPSTTGFLLGIGNNHKIETHHPSQS